MNVHHLELFHFVAKHGGVSAAARHMPYGIQQPAISAQILQLEDALGVTLFQRRPFKLTAQGRELHEFIAPFFNGLGALEERLRGGSGGRLRIAAPEIVQGDYLPLLLRQVRKRLPEFHFTLVAERIGGIEEQLRDQQVDIGLASMSGRCPDGLRMRELLRLPMLLLVAEKSRVTSAEQILSQDRISQPLISLPATEPVSRLFQAELARRKLNWNPAFELSSLDLVSRYVAEDYGVGLTLAAPARRWPKGVRALPLPDFPGVVFCALWSGRLTPAGEVFMEEAARLARSLSQVKM
ncbi:MAG TPA: LysR family transcriptional regulator [Prosthecobacter sp.]|nr:LysR family transcriptional regulator [Prosthecobacter sp.]HRK16228.1 LysR family transcriptional regulator [Prosthecobacter sp.]